MEQSTTPRRGSAVSQDDSELNHHDESKESYQRNSTSIEADTEEAQLTELTPPPVKRSSRRSSRNLFSPLLHRVFSIGGATHEPVDSVDSIVDDDDESDSGTEVIPIHWHLLRNKQSSIVWTTTGISLVALVCFVIILVATRKRIQNGDIKGGAGGGLFCSDPFMSSRMTAVRGGFENGAVAADHPLCSDMGVSIMRDLGGNAIDAAVTVALCLGVANPGSSGLGGGAFILIHADPVDDDKRKSCAPLFNDQRTHDSPFSLSGKITEVIDCREVAPLAASTDMFSGLPDSASVFGGLAIGVPGELRGVELAHARHGKLNWSTVVKPVVDLAKNGVVVNPNLALEIGIMAKAYSNEQKTDYGLRALLTKRNSWRRPLEEGDILRNEKLGETLEAVMEHGSDALYTGTIADQVAQDIQAAGGIVTKEDIKNYRATLRSPVVAHGINGFSLVGVPPPSSGGATVIGAALLLASFSTPFAFTADSLSVHRLVEVCKHAFAIRMSLSDPAYNTEVVADAVNDLVNGTYMGELRKDVQDDTTLPLSRYGGTKWAQLNDDDGTKAAADAKEGDRRRRLASRFGYLEDGGTSHFSIVDKDGNAVAMTTSINTYFGSKVVSPSTGILFSNTMDDFANPGRPNYYGLKPAPSNYVKPGKRPLSSMSPTFVFVSSNAGDSTSQLGRLALVVGASGGPKIITAVLQIFVHVGMMGLSLYDAISNPRVHEQLIYHGAAVTTTEKSVTAQGQSIEVPQRTKDALTKRGHTLLDIDYTGTVQAVAVDLETNFLTAGCDIRKGGSPAGY